MLKQTIIDQLQLILKDLGISDVIPQLDIPTDLSHGDYTTNIAMQAFKSVKGKGERGKFGSPLALAEEIASRFTLDALPSVEKVEAVRPGFVNFWIAKEELGRNLEILLDDKKKVDNTVETFRSGLQTHSGILEGKKILVEYAHPNTHKEMHIGHMRTLITGEALCRLFESQGAIVFRANYQGDIGPHVAKALYGIEKIMEERGLALQEIRQWSNFDKAHFLGEGYVRGNTDYEEAKEQIDRINAILYEAIQRKSEARNPKSSNFLSLGRGLRRGGKAELKDKATMFSSRFSTSPLQAGLSSRRGNQTYDVVKLYKETHQWSLDYYDEFYQRFMTKFDRLFLESEMVTCGIQIVKDAIGKIFEEDDGAIIFPGETYGLHTRVFITKAGYPTYEGKEMCNGFTEYDAFHFDKKIHVVANEQSGYFQVVLKSLELLDPEKFKDKQYHLPMGMVQLSDRKMSSRTGDILTVDWLIDQVKLAVKDLFKEGQGVEKGITASLQEQIAIGAIKYSVLKVGCTQNVAFDIQKSVSLEGNSGPYLQYTYARTQSILRKAQNSPNFMQEQSSEGTSASVTHPVCKADTPPMEGIYPLSGGVAGRPGWVKELKSANKSDILLNIKSYYEIEEYTLMRQMYQFPEVVQKAAESYSPNVLCEYLFTLAQEFNLFYQKHRIIDALDQQDRQFRLLVTQAVGKVLSEGLGLLGIAAPERM